MIWQKYFKSMGFLAVVISQVVAIVPSLPSQLLAQSSPMKISQEYPPTNDRESPETKTGEGTRGLKFPPTSERGAPETTTGGGTRGNSCMETGKEVEKIPLTPLLPKGTKGITATPNPVLYWYVPQNSAEFGEFLVIDEKGNEVYLENFKLPPNPGIVKLRVPENASLKTDIDYSWTLSLVCDSLDRGRDQSVAGVVRFTEIDPQEKIKLDDTTLLDKAHFYAQQKIWHDTLHLAAQLYTDNPAAWEELLESVELEKIAKQPLLKCCTAEHSPFSNSVHTLD